MEQEADILPMPERRSFARIHREFGELSIEARRRRLEAIERQIADLAIERDVLLQLPPKWAYDRPAN